MVSRKVAIIGLVALIVLMALTAFFLDYSSKEKKTYFPRELSKFATFVSSDKGIKLKHDPRIGVIEYKDYIHIDVPKNRKIFAELIDSLEAK